MKQLSTPKLFLISSALFFICAISFSACFLFSTLPTNRNPTEPPVNIVSVASTTQLAETAPPTLVATSTLPAPSQTPTSLPASPTSFSLHPCIPANPPQLGLVTRVVDGDTIHAIVDGQDFPIRYIGIDTPENTTKVEPFGAEATQKNAELVNGKVVTLVKDVSETDKYGRLLRYVLVDNAFVNLVLVQEGFANAVTYPPDVACADAFLQAERQAREANLGLWGLLVIPALAQPTPPTQASGNSCDPSYPDVCIPPPPPDLDCPDIPHKKFKVLPPDPHNFDKDHDGIGCER